MANIVMSIKKTPIIPKGHLWLLRGIGGKGSYVMLGRTVEFPAEYFILSEWNTNTNKNNYYKSLSKKTRKALKKNLIEYIESS